jgi:hypothetical protein
MIAVSNVKISSGKTLLLTRLSVSKPFDKVSNVQHISAAGRTYTTKILRVKERQEYVALAQLIAGT